jgi:hypothetical protein
MILIRFPNTEFKRRALGLLAGRFSFKSWASGEMVVPETALPFLATQGVKFLVDGPASGSFDFQPVSRSTGDEPGFGTFVTEVL